MPSPIEAELIPGVMVVAWVEALRLSYLVYLGLVWGLSLLLLGRPRVPLQIAQLIQGAALLWPLAYLLTLRDIPHLGFFDHFFGWIFPAICLFCLPYLLQLVLYLYYFTFGWPSSLRHLHRKVERAQLEQSLLRRQSSKR